MMMTRRTALLVLLSLSVNVEAGFLSPRFLRDRTRNRDRDNVADVTGDAATAADSAAETPAEQVAVNTRGAATIRAGRNYRAAIPAPVTDGTISFAGSNTGGGPGTRPAADTTDLGPPPLHTGDPEVPPMEGVDSMNEEVSGAPGGSTNGDQLDTPNVDGGDAGLDFDGGFPDDLGPPPGVEFETGFPDDLGPPPGVDFETGFPDDLGPPPLHTGDPAVPSMEGDSPGLSGISGAPPLDGSPGLGPLDDVGPPPLHTGDPKVPSMEGDSPDVSGISGAPPLDGSPGLGPLDDVGPPPLHTGDPKVPSMEGAPEGMSEISGAPGGNGGDVGDTVDTPNGAPYDLGPPPLHTRDPEVPPMEGNGDAAPGLQIDGADDLGPPPLHTGDPEAPSMEGAPEGMSEISGAPGGNDAGDTFDSPNGTPDDLGPPPIHTGDPEVPSMEGAPQGMSEVNGAPGGNVGDTVDTPTPEGLPNDLEDPNDGMEEAAVDEPIVLPFAEQSEGYILGHTAAVCASTQAEAEHMCGSAPICKFRKEGDVITNQKQDASASNCVRRCDSPLGDNHCQPHEECFRFTFGCKCAPFEFDGGSCQPY